MWIPHHPLKDIKQKTHCKIKTTEAISKRLYQDSKEGELDRLYEIHLKVVLETVVQALDTIQI